MTVTPKANLVLDPSKWGKKILGCKFRTILRLKRINTRCLEILSRSIISGQGNQAQEMDFGHKKGKSSKIVLGGDEESKNEQSRQRM